MREVKYVAVGGLALAAVGLVSWLVGAGISRLLGTEGGNPFALIALGFFSSLIALGVLRVASLIGQALMSR